MSIDAWRLLRIVRLRRALRLLCLLAVLAIPAWAVLTLGAEKVLPRTSSTFWAIDATIGPGFLIIGAVLSGAFLLLAGSGLLGRAGRTAAKLVPVFGRAPGLEMAESAPQAGPLYGLLHHRRRVRVVAVLIFMVLGIVGVFTALAVWPAWQANHGHGGPVVTIGKTATIASSTVSSHGIRSYFLATPYGTAIAEDRRPRNGQRWTVLANSVGNDEAYLIGGHDYLLIGAVALACALADTVIALRAIAAAPSRRRARRAARAAMPGTLADSLDYLSSGHPVHLRLARRRPVTVTLTMRPTGARSAQAWLARQRRITLIVTLTVAAAACTTTGLWAAGVFRSPPVQRNLTLAFLRQTNWAPGVFISYQHLGIDTEVLRDSLRGAGAPAGGATVTALVMVSSRQAAGDGASIHVASITAVTPSTAAADVMAFNRKAGLPAGSKATSLTGLPHGWQGVSVITPSYGSTGADIEIAGGADGYLLQISLYGSPSAAGRLAHSGSDLARVISRWGIARFSSAVAP